MAAMQQSGFDEDKARRERLAREAKAKEDKKKKAESAEKIEKGTRRSPFGEAATKAVKRSCDEQRDPLDRCVYFSRQETGKQVSR